MTSAYDEIYNRFLGKIKDVEFANFSEADAREQMREWLHSSLSKPNIRRLFGTLSLDDEIAIMTYTMKYTTDDLQDKDFVEELLSYSMVSLWLEPQVNTTTLLHQMISNSKESKYYSQASHMAEMQNYYENAKNMIRSLIADRGFINNSYKDKR